jgi:hypothetical protein
MIASKAQLSNPFKDFIKVIMEGINGKYDANKLEA